MKKLKGVDVTYDTKSLAESFNWQLVDSMYERTWSGWMREFADYINRMADEREKEELNEEEL